MGQEGSPGGAGSQTPALHLPRGALAAVVGRGDPPAASGGISDVLGRYTSVRRPAPTQGGWRGPCAGVRAATCWERGWKSNPSDVSVARRAVRAQPLHWPGARIPSRTMAVCVQRRGKPSSPGAAFHLRRERATQERGLQRSPQVTQRGLLSLYFDMQVHVRTRGFLISEVPTAAQERIAWHLGVVSRRRERLHDTHVLVSALLA